MAGLRQGGGGKMHGPPGRQLCSPHCLSCTLSLALLLAGSSYIFASLSNKRSEMVSQFNNDVRTWMESERSKFAAWRFFVAARWKESSLSSSMDPREEMGFRLRDEGGEGIESYIPLMYGAVIEFQSTPEFQAMPEAFNLSWLDGQAAPMAAFHFTARSSTMTVPVGVVEYPLISDIVTGSMKTDAARKCRVMHGEWKDHECHRVRRLSRLCLQVDAQGVGWQLRNSSGCYSEGPAEYTYVTAEGGQHEIEIQMLQALSLLIVGSLFGILATCSVLRRWASDGSTCGHRDDSDGYLEAQDSDGYSATGRNSSTESESLIRR
eukprot:TRINITY_DN8735_c0_g1_i2.p1 TRINITY_DN8735_c0_g1~~TRINITY_DN8735_c0_g1_i2.p1  ORF type:complete len:349 (+),score=57.87 TRINITY_DN8735_c0_g1_i2:85-1047(+)